MYIDKYISIFVHISMYIDKYISKFIFLFRRTQGTARIIILYYRALSDLAAKRLLRPNNIVL